MRCGREALILGQRNRPWGSGTAKHSALLDALLCAAAKCDAKLKRRIQSHDEEAWGKTCKKAGKPADGIAEVRNFVGLPHIVVCDRQVTRLFQKDRRLYRIWGQRSVGTRGTIQNSFEVFSYHSCFSLGYRSMNTKLALSALVAALMLTACAKQEAASPDTAAAPPASTETPAPAPAAPAADAPAAAPADGTAAPPPADAPAAPPKQ
jgi:hypothetical protein